MSAAFETVDHITLLDRLHTELGIGGTVLDWFESYLVNRYQVVAIGGEHSDSHLLRYGVPPRIRPRTTAVHCVHIAPR